MLSFEDLALISALASTGRPRKAAELLRTHPATIYRRLKALERQLGAAIFDKKAGAYVPSSLGDDILSDARDIEAQLAEVNRRLSGRDVRLSGIVTVTTTDTLVSRVSAALAAFRSAHPQVQLHLNTDNAMADMGRNEADIAVRPTSYPPETLIGRKVGAFGYGIYGARDFARLASPGTVFGAELSDVPWISLGGGLATHPAAQWIEAHVPAHKIVLRTNSMLSAMGAVQAGLGVALLPTYLGDEPRSGIVKIGNDIADMRSDVWILVHPDLMRAPRVKILASSLARYLKPMLRPAFCPDDLGFADIVGV
jgi:DNA-binding transcriptional LysR family regulator